MSEPNDDVRDAELDALLTSDIAARVQQALGKQLEEDLKEVSGVLFEQKKQVSDLRKKREDVGSELYGVHQHLNRLRDGLEAQERTRESAIQRRSEKESSRETIQTRYMQEKQEVEQKRAALYHLQSELDRVNETLTRIDRFGAHLNGEIASERRIAFKEAAAAGELEKKKDQQDDYVASLESRVRRLEDTLAAANGQLAAQRNETHLAKEVLSDAVSEISSINMHKTRLSSEWSAALQGVARRDAALRAAEEQLAVQAENLQATEAKIRGVKATISAEQQRNQQLTGTVNRSEAEKSALLRKGEATAQKLQAAQGRFELLTRSLATTVSQTDETKRHLQAEQREVAQYEKQLSAVQNEVSELERSRLEVLSSQATLKQVSHAGLDLVRKARQQIRNKELTIAEAENQLARLRVDALQIEAQNAVRRETLAGLNADIKEKEKLVELMEQDIRRKNDEIQRRQKELDAMNRVLEQTLAKQGGPDGDAGPLEAAISSISRSITEAAQESDRLQREWVHKQTSLVKLKNEHQRVEEEVTTLGAQSSVLAAKRARLENDSHGATKDIAALERELDALHRAQRTVNGQLADNSGKHESLASDALDTEKELMTRLVEQRQAAEKAESGIEGAREEKRQLIEDLLEQERQHAFWQKKLEIARETETALDPANGREELTQMEKEIGYMEHRHQELTRQVKAEMARMLQVVEQRPGLKVKARAARLADRDGRTQGTLLREMQRMEHSLKQQKKRQAERQREIADCMAAKAQVAEACGRMAADLDAARQSIAQQQAYNASRVAELDTRRTLRKISQNKLAWLREAESKRYRIVIPPDRHVSEKTVQRERADQLRRCVDDLKVRGEPPQEQ